MTRYLTLLFLLFVLCAWADGVQNRALAAVLDSGRPYHARATQIAKVRSNLCQSDVDAVHAFLERKNGGDLAPLEFNSLKNDLVLCLMRQSRPDGRLVPHLIAMYRDASSDLVWRNYCVQFMGRVYPTATAGEKEQLEEALQAVLEDPVPMLAVTGMIAVNLNGDAMQIDRNHFHERAFELLRKDIPLYVKVTLIQLCGMNRVRPDEVRPMLRGVLKDSEETQLKAAAIAALGEYGFYSDLEAVAPYLKSSDIRLKAAAATADRKIKDQMNQ